MEGGDEPDKDVKNKENKVDENKDDSNSSAIFEETLEGDIALSKETNEENPVETTVRGNIDVRPEENLDTDEVDLKEAQKHLDAEDIDEANPKDHSNDDGIFASETRPTSKRKVEIQARLTVR